MRRTLCFPAFIVFVAAFASFSAACTTAPEPLYGCLYTNVKFDGNYNGLNDVESSKTAQGCVQHFMYLAAWGNAAAGSIADKAGIKRIARIDHTSTEFLFIYGRYCTIVSGD